MSENTSQTRDALLDAAERLFSERGQASVGTREIAEEAGVNLASIRYHFGSKLELYLETVRRAMASRKADSAWSMLEEIPQRPDEAAVVLVRFIRTMTANLLSDGEHRSCGALMLWEAVQPSAAIDDVVRDYIKPSQDLLVGLVDRLLAESDRPEAESFARSILAQVVHYRVFMPFIERLHEGDARSSDAGAIADHVARFSLRALGHDDAFIEQALATPPTPPTPPTPAPPQPPPAILSQESKT